jgi:cell division protein FtsL
MTNDEKVLYSSTAIFVLVIIFATVRYYQ